MKQYTIILYIYNKNVLVNKWILKTTPISEAQLDGVINEQIIKYREKGCTVMATWSSV